jgi:hypothetical protein
MNRSQLAGEGESFLMRADCSFFIGERSYPFWAAFPAIEFQNMTVGEYLRSWNILAL